MGKLSINPESVAGMSLDEFTKAAINLPYFKELEPEKREAKIKEVFIANGGKLKDKSKPSKEE